MILALRPLLPAALLLCGGCVSPLGGEELDLGVGIATSPGIGPRLEVAQRMVTRPGGADVHAEALLVRTTLGAGEDIHGEVVDDGWAQVSGGLRVTFTPADRNQWFLRAGLTWVRAQGDPVFLDGAQDYGGVHLGVGRRTRLSPHLTTGWDVTLLGLLPEGSSQAGGVVPQVAWSLVWHP